MKHIITLLLITLLNTVAAMAQIVITESGGWYETVYVKWEPFTGATSYNVYYSGDSITNRKIDNQLIRKYASYYRADVVGITAGDYTIKVVPVVNGVEDTANAIITTTLTAKTHVREGFAFVGRSVLGTAATAFVPGAYNMDGTPKTGAQIIYVSSTNVNTVTANVINEKKVSVTVTGLMNIIAAKDKGYDKTPLIIRMLGTIKQSDVTGLTGSGGIYIGFIGANTTDRLIENITFEGIGDDATVYEIGFYTKRTRGIEIRNVGIMLFKDDGVSMESNNFNIWVHNCDFFYGTPGSDDDQVKGDGSIDMKYSTTNITISYNHFFDSGKTTFAGGATEDTNSVFFTYHHNWFDHTDSRNARICWGVVHMYNNYMDGNATMDLLNTEPASVFMEANKFRNCPYPMMINMQGTNYEKWPSDTQDGGMTKAYNNAINMSEVTKLLYQSDRPKDFDAYWVTTRNEIIPDTVKSRTGGNIYNNFDTDVSMYSYTPQNPEEVAAEVTARAGRMNGGDFQWTFDNAVDDNLTVVNTPLKSAIVNYVSSLVGVQGIDNLATGVVTNNRANPATFCLEQNYPNPFNPTTTIVYTIPQYSKVALMVYDVLGRQIATLVNELKSAGTYTVLLNVSKLSSGVYFYRFQSGSFVQTRKMLLLK
jgi:pectate lyase